MRNIFPYEGIEYEMVNRLANIGEYVVYHFDGKTDGNLVRKVTEVTDEVVRFKPYYENHEVITGFGHEAYRVLVPIDSEEVFVDTTHASPDVTDLLANLARRVSSLEDQLRSTQRNLETTAEELANTRHRLAKHADRFAAVEDKVEMLTDDVVTLDSRSQVLNAINKYYAEGSR